MNNTNLYPISHRFRDITMYLPHFSLWVPLFNALVWGQPREYRHELQNRMKTEWFGSKLAMFLNKADVQAKADNVI